MAQENSVKREEAAAYREYRLCCICFRDCSTD